MYAYKKIKLKNGKTIDEHRNVMQLHVGRKLHFDECVHHIDGNKRNNELSNLQIISRADHIRHHIKTGEIKASKPSEEAKKKQSLRCVSINESTARRIKFGNERGSVISRELGISKFIISNIRRNKTWKHLLN